MNNSNGKFLIAFTILLFLGVAVASNKVKSLFSEYKVVSDVIPHAPQELLKVTYGSALNVDLGNDLRPIEVKSQPNVQWNADPNAFYTLIMIDADGPGRSNPERPQFKHWLVGNILGTNINDGEVLAEYVAPAPRPRTGLHRFTFLVYKQPGKVIFEEQPVSSDNYYERYNFETAEFAKKYGFDNPIAGNFFQAQQRRFYKKKELSG